MNTTLDYKKTFVSINTHLADVLKVINETDYRIALVVDDQSRLIGTITDGDIRRGLVSGKTLNDVAESCMSISPVSVLVGTPTNKILEIMNENFILQIPIVSSNNEVVDLVVKNILENESVTDKEENNPYIVLFLGGEGRRLRPITEDIPKPMVLINGIPLLKIIIQQFVNQGFKKFFFVINYKGNVISEYFGNGEKFGIIIKYIEENETLGTAGSLAELDNVNAECFIVMNGDILTDISFNNLLDFHRQSNVSGTMCVAEYIRTIPYGVVKHNGVEIENIVEKPLEKYYINAGIYILDADTLNLITKGEKIDMPDLFDRVSSDGQKTIIYPIHEYWLDVGNHENLERARKEFNAIFGNL